MERKQAKKIKRAGSLLGIAALLSGCQTGALDVSQPEPVSEVAAVDGETVRDGQLENLENEVSIYPGNGEEYKEIANVEGRFSFDQDVLTPADDVFNMFGTAVTGVCAKPSFALSETDRQTYYINVKGQLREQYSISLSELKEKEAETKTLTCSCATSPAIANARVTGARIEDLLPLQELDESVNTITLRDKEGYGLAMPLAYVLDHEGLLVWSVNGTELSDENGGPLQVWMPDTVARYFTRQVCEIELGSQGTVPELEHAQAESRAKVAIVNRMENAVFAPGTEITFEGYADDCGQRITALEFSLDRGKTWTSYETTGSTSERWVYWNFIYQAEETGTFELQVQARCEDGTVSPIASSVVFTVEQPDL